MMVFGLIVLGFVVTVLVVESRPVRGWLQRHQEYGIDRGASGTRRRGWWWDGGGWGDGGDCGGSGGWGDGGGGGGDGGGGC